MKAIFHTGACISKSTKVNLYFYGEHDARTNKKAWDVQRKVNRVTHEVKVLNDVDQDHGVCTYI